MTRVSKQWIRNKVGSLSLPPERMLNLLDLLNGADNAGTLAFWLFDEKSPETREPDAELAPEYSQQVAELAAKEILRRRTALGRIRKLSDLSGIPWLGEAHFDTLLQKGSDLSETRQNRAGKEVQEMMHHLSNLELMAQESGLNRTERISWLRKQILPQDKLPATYAGLWAGGGAWDWLIPHAPAPALPDEARFAERLETAGAFFREHGVVSIFRHKVNLLHLFSGLDARFNPSAVSLLQGRLRLRSNLELLTWAGDLGAVTVHYLYDSPKSIFQVARYRDQDHLDQVYQDYAREPDMAANADVYALEPDQFRSLTFSLKDYIFNRKWQTRYSRFAEALGLGARKGNRFSQDIPATRANIRNAVFHAALAYAAATGRRQEVVQILKKPGPGILAPTLWEAFFNASDWVTDHFIDTLWQAVKREERTNARNLPVSDDGLLHFRKSS